ncbi:MAG: efflux RND transporter permease subunit [Bdellovibrionales bacterium]|nr:efflux RND transporter permease subunit [Bdellovibrionales bacterium]
MKDFKKGFAGHLAEAFAHSKLTLVTILVSLVLGIGAVWLTPKEEEPQIVVPMIDIMTQAPGLEAKEVERYVTEVIERAVWGLDGVEYVYSASQPHGSLITVRFKVNEDLEDSLVKIHHKLRAIQSQLPADTPRSVVKSYSIDDVPFLTLTFSSQERDDYQLRTMVAPLARELSSTPNLSRVELLGGRKRTLRVLADPVKMKNKGINLADIENTLRMNHAYFPVGKNWSKDNAYSIDVGARLDSKENIENTAIAQRGGRVIQIKDVANVIDGPEAHTKSSVLVTEDFKAPAVTIVFAKRKGTNVVQLTKDLLKRTETFSSSLPKDIKLSVTRNYGETASDKSFELIEHLLIATFSVAILIALAMGFRAALVVSIAIPVTLALTLAIYYFLGYTLNRVTLFALIFSIGILVDDAIVVVENIERHLKHRKKGESFLTTTIRAVSEVGNPTILATFTVIAAILPMAFVRGLMGPYMAPIPVGASIAMLFSLIVAFMITPWASLRILKEDHGEDHEYKESKLDKAYRHLVDNLLDKKKNSILFALFTAVLFVMATSLFYFKTVRVKMLPFDNKTEFQVLLDYPPTTPLETAKEWSTELAEQLVKDKNVTMVQVYAGEPAPYSFSGMVKHTFLRQSDHLNDLQVLLTDSHDRDIKSHEIINQLRPIIKEFADSKKAVSKVLEIPPGPPVMATMVAEVYGPDEASRRKTAQKVYDVFNSESSVVDLDYSWRLQRPRLIYPYDHKKAGVLGTKAIQLVQLGQNTFSEHLLFSLDSLASPEEIPVTLSILPELRDTKDPFELQTVPSFESGVVNISNAIGEPFLKKTEVLHRKNLKPVDYVMSELAGDEEAPVYGMMKITPLLKDYKTQTASVPWNTTESVIKWDGEWFITYEVFRDLGAAFAVVLLLIYVLVLGWFKSFSVPIIIMAPIPISLIGIIPGHALFGTYFTATSMIGFIAGAGIIVRNSIILVDFMEHQLKQGLGLKQAVVSAGVLRFRPMLLTAAAVVVGSSVMLADPIFQGLALSLIFGEVAATLLSRIMIPILYFWFVGKQRQEFLLEEKALENA